MPETKQVITGDSASAQKAYADLARQVVKLEETNQKMTAKLDQGLRKGSESQGRMNQMINQGISQLASMAAGWVGVTAVIAGANKELEEHRKLMENAGGKQISMGKAQATLAFNTLDDKQFQQAVKDVDRIADKTGFPDRAILTEGMGNAISASGGKYDDAVKALEAAAKITRITPEQLGVMTGAGLDIARAAQVTPEEGIALSLKTGKEARVNDPKLNAKNTAQGVSKAALSRAEGADARTAVEEAAETQAWLGLAGNDVEGDTSRTANWKLSQNLDDLFEGRMFRTFRGRKIPVKPSFDPGTEGKRLEQLAQESPAIKKHFLENMTVESYAPIVRDYLENPEGEQGKTRKYMQENIDFGTGPIDWIDKTLKGATDPLFIADVERESQASVDKELLNLTREGLIEKAMEVRDNALANTRHLADMPFGLNWTKDTLATKMEDIIGPELQKPGSTWGFLDSRQQEILSPKSLLGNMAGLGKRDYSELQGSEKTQYDKLEADKRLMERIADRLESLDGSNREMNERDKQNRPSAAPAARAEVGAHGER